MLSINACTSVIRLTFGTCILVSALFTVPAAAHDLAGTIATDNAVELFNQGHDNQVILEQAGELNSLNLLIQANNVAANIYQQGSANLIAGVNGAPALTMVGHNSLIDIVQNGVGNQVFAIQMSANSSISVNQQGNGNSATIIQR